MHLHDVLEFYQIITEQSHCTVWLSLVNSLWQVLVLYLNSICMLNIVNWFHGRGTNEEHMITWTKLIMLVTVETVELKQRNWYLISQFPVIVSSSSSFWATVSFFFSFLFKILKQFLKSSLFFFMHWISEDVYESFTFLNTRKIKATR